MLNENPEVFRSEPRRGEPTGSYSVAALDRISQVLRGEISAVEAYEHVLNRFALEPGIDQLNEIKNHHETAVSFWSNVLAESGVEPDDGSGPWGEVVKTFVDTAQLFGNTATLRALHVGESHGLNEYQELLMDSTIPDTLKDTVRETLIPKQEQHIALIEAWKGA